MDGAPHLLLGPLLTLLAERLAAAKAGDWQWLMASQPALQDAEDALAAQLPQLTLNAAQRDALRQALEEAQSVNAATLSLASAWHAELAELLQSSKTQQKLQKAYGVTDNGNV